MKTILLIPTFAIAFLFASASTASADYEVINWDLVTFISDTADSGFDTNYERITAINNPFLQNASAAIRNNTAMSQYDMSWLQDAASFGHDFSSSLEDPDILQAFDNRMNLIPDRLTTMNISGTLDFASVPNDLMDVFFRIRVRDVSSVPSQSIFSTTRVGGNSMLFPSSGTLTIEDIILLQPNIEYLITWYIEGDSNVEPNPAGPLTIDGSVRLTLTSIPEPHTALLLLCIAAFAVARRHRAKLPNNAGRLSPDSPSL